ncbi:MAG: hypothetical protein L6Q97_14055 [Thermoanaerobaculia bacterium]|nr:hypothetical protein [Thermoanaerobaculia bacterium]
MRFIAFLLFIVNCSVVSAQSATILAPQKAPASPAPATVEPASGLPANGDARRAAAVAKVQGKTPATARSAKGDDMSPVTYSTMSAAEAGSEPATTVTVNGKEQYRDVRRGRGQEHFGVFTPVDELHFVQFGVFCNDAPVTHAPDVDGVYLVWHAESTCPGGTRGAAYIVKGFPTAEEAKAEASALKARGIDCWYNPVLTGVKVEIIGVR